MKEVMITIPENCELVKDGDNYVVREKMQNPPRSWEEFCERYPIKRGEAWITTEGCIHVHKNRAILRMFDLGRNHCVTEEEAEAFLALMQLRQLRKAWVGDWERPKGKPIAGVFYSFSEDKITTSYDTFWTNVVLSFPTKEMAEDFLSCFKDLCETAKILL